ncbi:MAG: L-aspartate oxidase [Gammaproteobacteria bacterium]|nr:L-aspartate oxidase [Gammaproteobacteria bacterium]MDH3430985.1 L-aspartate oxidase [Gammaproteobacteria bacterium]MDH3433651.1 L-aspartate oxidase [Gammaproteobacteria bacterium]
MNVREKQAMMVKHDDVVVVGSGIGGLACALSLAPRSVTLITKTPQLQGGSSLWAQGGIAAAVGPNDSPEAHAADTLSAGAGLSDPERTRQLTEEGAASLQWLVEEGIPFDRDLHGALALAKEAAHQFARVAHAGGDTTGQVLIQSLIERVREAPTIRVLEDSFACDLVVRKGRIQGLVAFNRADGWVFHKAPQVVLATGGIGMAWWHTTNPVEATGDGLAMAARAGARLANLEFVQFHPTAMAVESGKGASLPLLTEALRGAGALLLDESGERFMLSEHPLAELAPRDVVARAIHRKTRAGQRVLLDLRPVLTGAHSAEFPQAIGTARAAGFDPFEEPLPITPAAHYHMGGVEVDDVGRTSIEGLWACGEVATTGIHGANRLASNSLLEALVYARRIAKELRRTPVSAVGRVSPEPGPPNARAVSARVDLQSLVNKTRDTMSRYVGILRSGDELETAYSELADVARKLRELGAVTSQRQTLDIDSVRQWGEARNLILIARLVTLAALRRKESRGAHFRDDYPQPRPEWRKQQSFTVAKLREAH